MSDINWISENKEVDDFIQEMRYESTSDYVFEWIPYNQFINIKKTEENDFITAYSATWKDGPLNWNERNKKYARDSNRTVALKRLHGSQNSIDFVINEV